MSEYLKKNYLKLFLRATTFAAGTVCELRTIRNMLIYRSNGFDKNNYKMNIIQ